MMAGGAVLAGCASRPADPSTASQSAVEPTGAAAPASSVGGSGGGTVTCEYEAAGPPARPVDPPSGRDVPASGTVTFTLNMTEGQVALALDRAVAPCTVNSFAALVQQGFYNDTSCHRLVDRGIFVLQCGDPTGTGTGGPGYRYADELAGNETYPAGTVAMANAGPDTNGSQFFLVWADTQLSPDYTVFGKMDEASLAVVAAIAAKGVSRDASPKPISPAHIDTVSVG